MNKYSFIIPFRDGEKHLSVLVPHLRNYAANKNIKLETIFAEKTDTHALRRGAYLPLYKTDVEIIESINEVIR
jgi:hypothetical protein